VTSRHGRVQQLAVAHVEVDLLLVEVRSGELVGVVEQHALGVDEHRPDRVEVVGQGGGHPGLERRLEVVGGAHGAVLTTPLVVTAL
jgi:hypothetical protein